jgi:DNA-binding MarR family transcriptional regulator
MHMSNVWAAWTLRSEDALTAALPPGLGPRDVAALTLIDSHAGCSVDWLWARIGLTQSGTVRLLDRLQSLEYVDRVRAGRGVRLTLTSAGAEVLAGWNAARDQAGSIALGGLTAAEQRQLTALLAKGLRNTGRPRDVADTTCRLCEWPACTRCPVDESVTASAEP